MEHTEKIKLYNRVRLATSHEMECLACIEEQQELCDACDNVIVDLRLNNGISMNSYLNLVDEICDSIITTEKVTKNFNMLEDIERRMKVKLRKLERHYLEDTLEEGLDLNELSR